MVLLISSLLGCTRRVESDDPQIRIGILTIGSSRAEKIEGMRKGLQEMGWTDKQVDYRIHDVNNNQERLVEGAKDLLALRPNIVVATGVVEAEAIFEAMKNTPPIPVVLIGVTSPSELELKNRFHASGIPVTGVDNGHVELTAKRIELLRELFPERQSVVVLYDPRLRASMLALQKANDAAQQFDWKIEPVPVQNDRDIANLRSRIFTKGESMLILPSYYLELKYKEIRDISFKTRTPVMGLYETETYAGYTASYGISYFDQGYQSARLVARMMTSKDNSDIPFEKPDVVQLKVNMKAIEQLDIAVSPIGMSYSEKIAVIRE
nr:ABC transporter substrate-binding protein [Effusibacillus lacus]